MIAFQTEHIISFFLLENMHTQGSSTVLSCKIAEIIAEILTIVKIHKILHCGQLIRSVLSGIREFHLNYIFVI